jgi:hypothetical protein
MEPCVPAALREHEQQTTSHSVRAPNVNSLDLDKIVTLAGIAVIQQIMKEFNGAVLKEAKIMDITKIVLNLMEQNGHLDFIGMICCTEAFYISYNVYTSNDT